MSPIRVLIADDEPPARKKLIRFLEAEPDFTLVAEALDGAAALEAVRAHTPEVVFLDIQMPKLNGFAAVAAMEEGQRPLIVFVTAHDQHALRAFEVQACGYLLKPFDQPRFHSVLQHVRERVRERRAAAIGSGEDSAATRLLLPTSGRSILLSAEQVDWIEAAGNYVEVHAGSETHLIRGTLEGIHQKLGDREFVRISRSHIVRIGAMVKLQPGSHGDQRVQLTNGVTLTWSRRFRDSYEALRERLSVAGAR
jgi:two-component system LytT family response regulator